MKLPNSKNAIVSIEKLRDYCLSPRHPRGRHKARVFEQALGLTAAKADRLRAALLVAAQNEDATPGVKDGYGERYMIDFAMLGPKGNVRIRSSWIIRAGEDTPRFVTCYVL